VFLRHITAPLPLTYFSIHFSLFHPAFNAINKTMTPGRQSQAHKIFNWDLCYHSSVTEVSSLLWCCVVGWVTPNISQNRGISFLDLMFTIPKCLNYRNKGKDHNSQTQQYFIMFSKYIYNSRATCSNSYQVILRPSGCRSGHTKVYCIVGSPAFTK